MNNSDHLYEIAFDGTDHELEQFLASASESAKVEISELSQLKADLKSLRDIPECQLSTERLKEGILGSKVAPAPKRYQRWQNWLPLASAVAMGIFLYNLPKDRPAINSGSDQEAVAQVQPESANKADGLKTDDTPKVQEAITSNEPQTKAKNSNLTPKKLVAKSIFRQSSRTRSELAMTATIETAAYKAVRDQESKTGASFSASGAPTMEADAKADLAVATEPVVIVTDVANPETGTAEAREITKSTDVVFGG